MWEVGSPPHLRGKQYFNKLRSHYVRITPAPAGKTLFWVSRALPHEDHPRTCGENQQDLADKSGVGRITPAPAGKTHPSRYYDIISGDHPRTCGENWQISAHRSMSLGSPPHLLGKLLVLMEFQLETRITPAPAGKTYLIS